MKISAIVASSENGGIGKKGKIPWNLKDDLAYFKSVTMGHTLIMGRKTYQSIGMALPGRRMIIVTRQPEFIAEGCLIVNTLREAFALAKSRGEEEVFIAGGSEIYYQTFDLVEKVYMTRVHAVVEADSYFPEVGEPDWILVSEERHSADEEHQYAFTFEVWERRRTSEE
jgi:dihydrofolate reductase